LDWNRTQTIGLASESCTYCHGMGTRAVYKTKLAPCNCVFRAIFRACLNRFRDCAASGTHFGTVSWEFCAGAGGRRMYSRKREEFMADFCLIANRSLDEEERRIFHLYFLVGADWKMCCRRLGIERGNFFHAVYRIGRVVGRAFAETEPYALYPLDEYFGGRIKKAVPLEGAELTPPRRRWEMATAA
jgi:hypothetical protein